MANELIERLNTAPIVHQGERCVTLDLIDQMHDRPSGTARKAFNRRKDKFTEGKHYHVLTYQQRRQGDNGRPLNGRPFGRGGNNGDAYLFTEKGYCLLVKTFDDDRAWAIQEELVDGYFRQQPQQPDATAAVAALMGQVVGLVSRLAERMDRLEATQATPYGPTFPIRDRLNDMVTVYEIKVSENWKSGVVRRIMGEAMRLSIQLTQRGDRGVIEMPLAHLPWVECVIRQQIQQWAELHDTPLFRGGGDQAA